MKRSGSIALALMGTASFGVSFLAGHAALNWMNRPKPTSHPVQQAACTPRPDGTQTCPSQPTSSSGTRVVYYYAPASNDRAPTKPSAPKSGAASASFSNSGASASAAKQSGVARSGFGSTGSSLSVASAGG
jgi:hypothetical protein